MTPENIREVSERAECLYTEEQVEEAIDAMAAAITTRLAESNPLLICVMNGGLIVSGKLATRLDFPLQLDYVEATRYRGATRGGELHWKAYPSIPLRGRSVLIVDDILDEGTTLASIVDYCKTEGAAAVFSAVLVDKQHQRKPADLHADFTGLQVVDRYLFGYGMDYKGYLRNAAGIFAVADGDA